mgnify:CR=1 FL=1
MTNTQLDLTADILDARDIIARVEELEESKTWHEEVHGAGDWADAYPQEAQELDTLAAILEDLKGYGGDEQWRGDWYPVILIRETHFTDYVQEMLEDCGEIPRDLPHYIHIDWERTARDVKVDYGSVTVDGVEYLYR